MKTAYGSLKGQLYWFVSSIVSRGGSADAWKTLMEDSDTQSMALFCASLAKILPSVKKRTVLLDGLAREYADCPNWMEYVNRECEAVEADSDNCLAGIRCPACGKEGTIEEFREGKEGNL